MGWQKPKLGVNDMHHVMISARVFKSSLRRDVFTSQPPSWLGVTTDELDTYFVEPLF
jgi:hypothetical protein